MGKITSGYPGIDRRKYPRINAAIKHKVVSDKLPQQLQNTNNISAGGIAFFLKDKVEVGNMLEVQLCLPDGNCVDSKVEVVWREIWTADIGYEVGVEFIEVEEEDRRKISRYVFLRLDKS